MKLQIRPDHLVIVRSQEGPGDLKDPQASRNPAQKVTHGARRADRERSEGLPIPRRCSLDVLPGAGPIPRIPRGEARESEACCSRPAEQDDSKSRQGDPTPPLDVSHGSPEHHLVPRVGSRPRDLDCDRLPRLQAARATPAPPSGCTTSRPHSPLREARGMEALLRSRGFARSSARQGTIRGAEREATVATNVRLDLSDHTRKPVENAFIGSFNGRLRDECPNSHRFQGLDGAGPAIQDWRRDYDELRPHSASGDRSSSDCAAELMCQGPEARWHEPRRPSSRLDR